MFTNIQARMAQQYALRAKKWKPGDGVEPPFRLLKTSGAVEQACSGSINLRGSKLEVSSIKNSSVDVNGLWDQKPWTVGLI